MEEKILKIEREKKEEIVILDYPIQYGAKELKEIAIPRPKARHMKGLKLKLDPQGIIIFEPGLLLEMAPDITGMPGKIFDELDWSDALKVANVIFSFLSPGQGISRM